MSLKLDPRFLNSNYAWIEVRNKVPIAQGITVGWPSGVKKMVKDSNGIGSSHVGHLHKI